MFEHEDNIFVQSLRQKLAPTPWDHKRHGTGTKSVDVIVDYSGRPLATLEPAGGEYTAQQYRYTRHMLANAPVLVAMLTEAVITMDELNVTPSNSLLEMLRDVGGPNLIKHFQAKAANSPPNAEP